MKTIKPSALYWASFNLFELRLPGQCVIDCSGSGSADAAVARWVPVVLEQTLQDDFPNAPTNEKIRKELREYGAWDEDELSDSVQNFHRLVWIAACNIAEQEEPDCSEPVCHADEQLDPSFGPMPG